MNNLGNSYSSLFILHFSFTYRLDGIASLPEEIEDSVRSSEMEDTDDEER